VRTSALSCAAFNARDREASGRRFANDIVFEDRRAGLGALLRGRERAVDHVAAAWSLGNPRVDQEVVAIRGDRLMLIYLRTHGRSELSFGTEFVEVLDVNSDGEIVWGGWFDSTDMDAAFAELEARYLAGEAAPFADVWRLMVERTAALNRH